MADDEQEAVSQEEQQPDPEPEQESPLSEVVAETAEPEGDETPDPETTEPSGPDIDLILSDPDHLEAVLGNEAVQKRLKQATADAVNATRQEEQKKRSLEAGSDARVVQSVEAIAASLGINTGELTNQQTTQFRDAFASQSQFQAFEQARIHGARNIERFEISGDTVNTAVEFLTAGDGSKFVDTITDAVIASEVAKAKVEWETEQSVEVTRKVNLEVAARAKPNNGETIPEAPSGAGPGTGPSPSEYAAATAEQREKWGAEGVEVQIPQPV